MEEGAQSERGKEGGERGRFGNSIKRKKKEEKGEDWGIVLRGKSGRRSKCDGKSR